MLIVSQDKETILNFNNIQNTRIEEYGTHIKGKKIYKIYSGNFEGYATLLGTYETRERAKEVLQEIVILFKNEEMFHIRKSTLNNLDELAEPKYILKPVSRPKVYEMPEE